jgi:hypothetical protein
VRVCTAVQLAESEPKKFTAKVKVYLTDVWNVLDVVGIVLFFIGVITRFTWNPDYGHVWYTVSVTCFYSHIFDLYGVSKFLGTYITIVGKMVRTFHNVSRLIVVSVYTCLLIESTDLSAICDANSCLILSHTFYYCCTSSSVTLSMQRVFSPCAGDRSDEVRGVHDNDADGVRCSASVCHLPLRGPQLGPC